MVRKNAHLLKLAKMTIEELVSLKKSIEADPKNKRNKNEHSIYVYTRKAMKELEDITYTIMHKADC